MSKRCILFVVDALADRVVRQWIDKGRLPTLSKIIERGGTYAPCTSVFPSITPAATCSIATGQYPRAHGIEGACWFNPSTNDSAYFGDDIKLALQEGFREYLVDFGDRLNLERLQQPLIYEHLHQAGIESACINFMWFRGPHVHSRTTPFTLKLVAGSLDSDVPGPKYLKLGDFVHSLPSETGDVSNMKTGLLGRYGFHDQTTAACMMAMASSRTLPPFTLAYFPLNDDVAHEKGVEDAASDCVSKFDKFLAEFVEAIGGWDVIGSEYAMLVVGDHSQVEFAEDGPQIVRLDQILEDYSLADTAAGIQADDQLLVCPNMRAASIYSANPNPVQRNEIVEKLLSEDRIDQAIYEEDRPDRVRMLTVRTRDRGRLSFTRGQSSAELRPHAKDQYGNQWSIHGELTAVDTRIDQDGRLVDGIYPNALERIEGAFTGGTSPIWITAKPDAEFAIAETATHPGGSHGSLHRDDSIAALVCTSDIDFQQLKAPEAPRIVDVLDLCLQVLEVPARGDGESGTTPNHLARVS